MVDLPRTRCGYVALVGIPNAGKSTLINALVGGKVSIVTHKVQTTRAVVRGIVMLGDTQMVVVDTPGIFKPRRTLDRSMVKAAWSAAGDADVVGVLVDVKRGLDDGNTKLLEAASRLNHRKILILNKIDLVKKDRLLPLIEATSVYGPFDDVVMIAAETGDGVETLRGLLAAHMPEGPWLYDPDQLSDLPERRLAAEILREKLMLRLHEEVPYDITVETERWEERPDGSVRIEQVVYVARDAQKPIVIGKKGQTLKAFSEPTRLELETLLDRRVHLFVMVRVRENWAEDPERLEALGLGS